MTSAYPPLLFQLLTVPGNMFSEYTKIPIMINDKPRIDLSTILFLAFFE